MKKDYYKVEPPKPPFGESNLLAEGWRWWMIPMLIGVIVLLI